MKFVSRLVPLLLLMATAAVFSGESRIFTDKSGRSITAEIVSIQDGQVTLKRTDGQSFTIPMDTLSEADVKYLTSQLSTEIPRQSPTPAPPNSIVIESLIDGPSELRVKKDGIYWINGPNAKPGRHMGQEEPTYVDGKSWRPNWKEPRQARGVDRTATKSVDGIDPLKTDFKLLNVTVNRGGYGIAKRDPVHVSIVGDELSIMIPDSQGGSMWYRFALVKKD